MACLTQVHVEVMRQLVEDPGHQTQVVRKVALTTEPSHWPHRSSLNLSTPPVVDPIKIYTWSTPVTLSQNTAFEVSS